MRKELAATLAASFVLVSGAVFTAHSAMAASDEKADKVTPFENVGSGDTVKLLCPDGTTLVKGGYKGADPVNIEVSEPYTEGGNTGWFVQNGSQEQMLSLWVTCKPTVVTPETPSFSPATCEANGTLKEQSTKGIEYGYATADDGKSVTVTATPEEGFSLPAELKGWEIKGDSLVIILDVPQKQTGDACLTDVALVKPGVISTCDGLWYITPKANKQYLTEYKVTSAEVGKFTLKATLKPGFKVKGTKGDKTAEWTLRYNVPTNCPSPSPTPPTNSSKTPSKTSSETTNALVADPGWSNDDGGDMAPIGSSKSMMLGMFGTGALLLSIGGILLIWARRRREADEVESA